MIKTRNGQVYGKYIKIKGNRGAEFCEAYIDDNTKTAFVERESEMNGKGEEIYSVSAAVSYLENDVKVVNPENERHLVSGINCNSDSAAKEFRLVERMYHRHRNEALNPGHKANEAFHVILSYKGTDLDPELVHKLGCIFAERVCGYNFQAVVATHLNTGNYHNHVLINAYALNGKRKFKDELYLYRKFREIANEISSEYGLPIFLNNEKNSRKGYRSWKEMLETEEGSSWVSDLKTALEESIAVSASFEEVQEKMREKGYEITHNKRSESYAKDGCRVRDRKLGRAYTKEGISEQIGKKEAKEKRRRILEEIEERRKNHRVNARISPIYIPVYSGGRRRSFLKRLFLLLIEAFRRGWNEGHSEVIESLAPENPVFFDTKKKVKIIEEGAEIAEEIGVGSVEEVEKFITECCAERVKIQQEIRKISEYLDNTEEIERSAERYSDTVQNLKSLGIDPDLSVKKFSKTEIRKNLAGFDPMTKKTGAALYRSLHDSFYILDRRFEELGESDAEKMVRFLNSAENRMMWELAVNYDGINGDSAPDGDLKNELSRIYGTISPESVPDGLRFRYLRKVKEEEHTYEPVSDFKDRDAAERKEIKKDLKELDFLSGFNIDSSEKAAGFLNEIRSREERLREKEAELNAVSEKIKKAYRLSNLLNLIQKAGFVFGPLYTGSTEPLEISLRSLVSEADKEEFLKGLLKDLKDVLGNDQTRHFKKDPPEPKEYRLLNYLQPFIPELKEISPNSKDIHEALEKILNEHRIEKIIGSLKREEEIRKGSYR